jgi:molybdenum cofactor cytidylyltransferase
MGRFYPESENRTMAGIVITISVVIPAIVLAAGESSRMGRPKPNLPIDDGRPPETFLTRIVRTFLEAGVEDVVVVIGHQKDAVMAAFSESALSARFVENRDYAAGQLSSLLAGLGVIDRPGVIAAMFTLVDVPFASAATVRAVLERYRLTRAPLVRPSRQGRHGHPLLVDRALFAALRHADPATGARPVIRRFASAAGDVEVDDEGAFTDIDTPEDYRQAIRYFGGGARGAEGSGP